MFPPSTKLRPWPSFSGITGIWGKHTSLHKIESYNHRIIIEIIARSTPAPRNQTVVYVYMNVSVLCCPTDITGHGQSRYKDLLIPVVLRRRMETARNSIWGISEIPPVMCPSEHLNSAWKSAEKGKYLGEGNIKPIVWEETNFFYFIVIQQIKSSGEQDCFLHSWRQEMGRTWKTWFQLEDGFESWIGS